MNSIELEYGDFIIKIVGNLIVILSKSDGDVTKKITGKESIYCSVENICAIKNILDSIRKLF